MDNRTDIDIMGYQRGAHQDGIEKCKRFVFFKPGGRKDDGTALWGWNDTRAVTCARCGARDIEHVLVKDTVETQKAKEETRPRTQKLPPAMPLPPDHEPPVVPSGGTKPSDVTWIMDESVDPLTKAAQMNGMRSRP